jgi:thiol-disulfide isomerase/thioredoxin
VATVGDKTLPIVSGIPGSSVMAEKVTPELRVSSSGRVSGRVVDAEGRPVPNAEVRLAVGGARGGRMHRATTDRSGAFTLRGLRPRASYTVIAELKDERGLLTGRSDVRAPDTDVRITLGSPEVDPDVETDRPSTRVSSISDQEELNGDDAERALVNEEDLLPGPDDPLPSTPGSSRRQAGMSDSSSTRGAGWRREAPSVAASHTSTSMSDPSDAPIDPEMQGTASASEVLPYDDDGINPLPPALEREAPPASPTVGEPDPVAPVEEEPGSAIPDEQASIRSAEPRRRPGRSERRPAESVPEAVPGALVVAPEPVEPPPAQVATAEPMARPSPLARQRPTWREVMSQSPLPRTVEGTGTPVPDSVVTISERKESARPRLKLRPSRTRTAAKGEELKTFCRYDAKNRRIEDFLLPDLEGKPVHFRDLDADLVLIDFWGTWCEPCVDSVPHLVELQERLGPGRLKVVGIACEKGPAGGRSAEVARTAERLGINYPLLLSSTEDPCPLQEALHIQAYPTMILVDRQGNILWRDQGSTPITLARLDRVIAASTPENPEVVRR